MQFLDAQMSRTDLPSASAIERWLQEVWPEVRLTPLRLLVGHQSEAPAEGIPAYAEYLARLLAAQLTYFPDKVQSGETLDDLVETAGEGYDLVILVENEPSRLKRPFKPAMWRQAVERMPTSILLARPPLRTLRRILFVTRGQLLDEVALDWLIALAQASSAVVTVLVVQPSSPAYFSETLERYGLNNWLTSDTPLGQQLRQIEQRLAGWSIEGRLRFRSGWPEAQIKEEIHESNPDLVIMAADPAQWWQKSIAGRLVTPLLKWVDRPVLVAK